ncbi:MAG: hypothetical protein R2778_14440 [Saprospiraceae bacterium]
MFVKNYPDFDNLDKEALVEAYKQCFAEMAFSKTKLHNLHSGLGKQIELFLSIQIFLKQGEEGEISPQEQFLITALGKRQAHISNL